MKAQNGSPSTEPAGKTGFARARAAAAADINAARREYYFSPPAWLAERLLTLLADPRDAPILWLFLNVSVTTVPAAAAMFALGVSSHLLGAAYLAANYAIFLQRFLLALHCVEHRKLLSRGPNWIPSLVLAPLFGLPSGLYHLHHCMMHHVEGNAAPNDLSSTEPYQRDNPLHFTWYWLRHSFGSWVELPLYALHRRRFAAAGKCLAVEAAYLGAMAALWRTNSIATTWVFLLPFVVSSFALMFGNWSQHVFIDASAPRDSYRLTYSCINAKDNQKSFNDGYHVNHHLNSKLHWTELPLRFQQTIDKHSERQALVFEGVGWFDVGAAVFCRRYDALLRWLLPYDGRMEAMSRSECILLLKSRLRPIDLPKIQVFSQSDVLGHLSTGL